METVYEVTILLYNSQNVSGGTEKEKRSEVCAPTLNMACYYVRSADSVLSIDDERYNFSSVAYAIEATAPA